METSMMEGHGQKVAHAFAVIELLAKRWPATFVVFEQRRQPLKIGIHLDILTVLDGALTKSKLRLGLSYYTNNVGYLRALSEGAARIDLAGDAVGVVSADEAQQAVQALDRLAAYRKLRQQGRAKAPAEIKLVMEMTRKTIVRPAPVRLGLADLKQLALSRRKQA
jgi:ProP effector